jgi:hypothetical protein
MAVPCLGRSLVHIKGRKESCQGEEGILPKISCHLFPFDSSFPTPNYPFLSFFKAFKISIQFLICNFYICRTDSPCAIILICCLYHFLSEDQRNSIINSSLESVSSNANSTLNSSSSLQPNMNSSDPDLDVVKPTRPNSL